MTTPQKDSGLTEEMRRELAAVAALLAEAEAAARDRLSALAARLAPSELIALMWEERVPWDAASYVWSYVSDLEHEQAFHEIRDPARCLAELAAVTDEALYREFLDGQQQAFHRAYPQTARG